MSGRPRSPLPGLKEILLPRRASRTPGGASTRLAWALFRPPETAGRPGGIDDVLRRVTLFEDLDRQELRRLSRIVHEREYRDGEYICEEGTPGAALFVLRSGTVEVLRRGADGRPLSLAVLEPPASFEESAATGIETVRRFSVRARGPVSLLALGKSDLDAMIVNFPVLANKVLLKLAGVMAMRLRFVLDAHEGSEADAAPEPDR
jgi:CRP-like cAMP-binding protein